MASSWEKLVETNVLSSTNANLDTGTFTPKKHLKVVFHGFNQSADSDVMMRVGTGGTIDDDPNYSWRNSRNDDDTDETNGSEEELQIVGASFNTTNATNWGEITISNIIGQEKLFISHTGQVLAGVNNAPDRVELVGKWANADDQIDNIRIFLSQNSAVYAVGASITVYGADDQGSTPFYPNISNGAIFEESDTGKHYMFDGSQTWNEM